MLAIAIHGAAIYQGRKEAVGDKHEVGVGGLVADKVVGLLVGKVGIDDRDDTIHLLLVPLNDRRELLRVIP